MSAGQVTAIPCSWCDWRASIALLTLVLSLSVFGAGVIVGQMIARDVPTCTPAVWP